jgi:phosphoserine phosphatase
MDLFSFDVDRTLWAVMEVTDRIAEGDVAPEELLEVATDSARRDVIGKEQAAEQVERDLERMSRERLLPDEKTLEQVARYEAHLS